MVLPQAEALGILHRPSTSIGLRLRQDCRFKRGSKLLFVASDPLVIFVCIYTTRSYHSLQTVQKTNSDQTLVSCAISKAQGQTFKYIAIYPPSPVSFSWPTLCGVSLILFM